MEAELIKAIFLIKRKAGITQEAFRQGYERHARLAQKYFGHLMLDYVRKYPTKVRGAHALGQRPPPWDYDVIGEWTLADQAALDAIYRVFEDPEIGAIFREDEDLFADRDSLVFITCQDDDVLDTGTRPAAST